MPYDFYKFAEDYSPSGVLARKCNYKGVVYEPLAPAVLINIHNPFQRPVGAKAGYIGLCWNRQFYWGHCVDTSCDAGTSEIDVGTVPEGNVNESYTHTITWTDLVDDPTLTGLPDGLSYDESTGEISGTPTEEGVFTIVITGTSDENECPITESFNLIINPCVAVDAYIDPDSPPTGTISVAYSHTILFDDLDGDPEASGLPPGLTFNGSTGEISGTPTSEGSWVVTISGVTVPNGCPISAQFVLTVETCDPGDSAIVRLGGGLGVSSPDRLQTGEQDEPYTEYILGLGLILPMTLDSSCSGCDFPSGLTFDGNTGIISGTPTECGDFEFDIVGETDPDECEIRARFHLTIVCPCPDPEEYATLAAWLIVNSNPTSSATLYTSVGISQTLTTGNATFNTSSPTVSNLPPGLTWDPSTANLSGIATTPGTYVTVFYGTVTSGTYAGCPIIHTLTYTVTDELPP